MKRAAILCLSLVVLASCGAEQVITDAELAVDALETLLPAIATTANLSASTQAQILTYTQLAGSCLSQAASLGANGLTPVIDAQIASGCAGVVAPQLPPGEPQNVVSLVSAAAKLVSQFIGQFQTVSPAPAGATEFFSASKKPVTMKKPSAKQLARIVVIKARADAVVAKAKAMKK